MSTPAQAPDYKQNPSIDGTTVNNGTANGVASGRQGKSNSPDGSEDIYRNVTEDTPRERRSAPPPGVMVGCLGPVGAEVMYAGLIADGLDCPAFAKERVCQHLIWHVSWTITDFFRMQPSYAQDLGVGSIEVCLPPILWALLTPADIAARVLRIHDEHSRFMCR
jgi:hypothetical protein